MFPEEIEKLNRLSSLQTEFYEIFSQFSTNIVMMMFFDVFLLRKTSEFPSGTRTDNLQIAGETL